MDYVAVPKGFLQAFINDRPDWDDHVCSYGGFSIGELRACLNKPALVLTDEEVAMLWYDQGSQSTAKRADRVVDRAKLYGDNLSFSYAQVGDIVQAMWGKIQDIYVDRNCPKINPGPPPITITVDDEEYEVQISTKGITVGCTLVDWETVDKIVERRPK